MISRRSLRNAGTRYTTRGTDEFGNPANFAEQEQFILFRPEDPASPKQNLFCCSFTQIRGSIPLLWRQVANLKYTPKVDISKDKEKLEQVCDAHLKEIISQYSKAVRFIAYLVHFN